MLKAFQNIQSSPFMNQPRRLSFSFRSLVAREPSLWFLYQPYFWWGQMKRKAFNDVEEGVLTPQTELVIDGFQGSANSFAVAAFKQSQKQPVKLMHHRHAPIMLMEAAKQGVPILLTIREPVDTVLSVTSRWSYLSVNQVLQSYIGFYSKLEKYTPYFVVSTFELTTQHLDWVVQAINEKFNTNFDLVDMAQVNTKRKAKFSSSEKGTRFERKQEKKRELMLEKNTQLLTQANEIYKKFETFAQQTVKPLK